MGRTRPRVAKGLATRSQLNGAGTVPYGMRLRPTTLAQLADAGALLALLSQAEGRSPDRAHDRTISVACRRLTHALQTRLERDGVDWRPALAADRERRGKPAPKRAESGPKFTGVKRRRPPEVDPA